MTDLRDMTSYLRITSDRYDVIPHYLTAADSLDRALSIFFRMQSVETLRDVQTAFSIVNRFYKESKAEDGQGTGPALA